MAVPPSSFHEHQQELCKLSEYIQEKQLLVNGVLEALGCSEEDLHDKPSMSKCCICPDHFISDSSLEEHERRCQYIVKHGLDKSTAEEFISLVDSDYNPSSKAAAILVDKYTWIAISEYCRRRYNTSVSHDSHVTQQALIEDSQCPSQETLQSLDPIRMIRYIKSWQLVPPPYCALSPPLLQPVLMKSWVYTNIPESHIYSNQMGGEMRLADNILACIYATPTLTPNVLLERLHPLLGSNCVKFVLLFWKFVMIQKMQGQHNIQDSVVQELLPLPLPDESVKQTTSSLVAEIQTIADSLKTTPTNDKVGSFPDVPVPSHHMTSHMTTEERRVMYDYIIELSQQKIGLDKDYLTDPNLFRDDVSMVTARQADGDDNDGRSYIEVVKEMRDYRRRRQSYRAKNVHITKKSTKQIFHDIIEARTKEISLSLGINTDEEERDDEKECEEDRERASSSNTSAARDRGHSPSKRRSYDNKECPIIKGSSTSSRRSSDQSSRCHRSRSPREHRKRSRSPHKSHSKHKSHSHTRSRSRSKHKSHSGTRSGSKHRKKHKHSSEHD